MRHKWDEGEMFMGDIVSTCQVCGNARSRKRVADVDYLNTGRLSVDMVGRTRKGWRYGGIPRSCPGKLPVYVEMTPERVEALEKVLGLADEYISSVTSANSYTLELAEVSKLLVEAKGANDGE